MSQIVIIGKFDVHAEDADAVGELMRVMMNETAKEKGCHHYTFARDLAVAHRFQLSELWEDDASLAAHFQSAHMAAYRAGLSKMRILKRSVKRFDAANSKEL